MSLHLRPLSCTIVAICLLFGGLALAQPARPPAPPPRPAGVTKKDLEQLEKQLKAAQDRAAQADQKAEAARKEAEAARRTARQNAARLEKARLRREARKANKAARKKPMKAEKKFSVSKHIRFRPGKGLSIQSADGKFSIVTRLRAQFRYTFEHDGDSGDKGQSFQIRRARLQFIGNMFGEHNQYKVELALSPRDIGLRGSPSQSPVLSWYMHFTYLRELNLRLGQYKVPFSRQRVTSSGNLGLVDRSIINGEFNLDRDIGLDLRSNDFLGKGFFRYYAGIYIGEGRDAFAAGDFGFMYLVRLEVLPLGMFKDYHEADLKRSRRARLSIGAAYAFIDKAKRNEGIVGSTPADGGTTDYHNITADIMFKWWGLAVHGAFHWRDGKRSPGDAVDDNGVLIPVEAPRNGVGFFLQTSYLVPRIPLAIGVRYALIKPVGDNTSLLEKQEFGGGLSYYAGGHPFKLQIDYFRIWGDDGTGRVRIGAGEDVVRVQLQGAL